jgi:Immunoglobulin domain
VLCTAKTRIVNPVPASTLAVWGSTVSLPCGVENDPFYNIEWRWYRNSSLVTTIRDPASVTIENDGSLRLSSVTKADIGAYRCDVDSTGGQDSSSGFLYIIGRQ